MYQLYSLLLFAYFFVRFPLVAYNAWRHGKALGNVGERFGRLPRAINPDHQRSIWIHAVSVGEVLAVRCLVPGLRAAYPKHRLLLSTTTTTGQQVAREFESAIDGTFFFPFDFTPYVARALDRVTPDLVVIVETELWPNLLRACRRRGVKTMLVNGRLSTRSYQGYRLVRPFMKRVLSDLDQVCVQSEAWAQRFVTLGVKPERLTVTGSLKFDVLDLATTGTNLHMGDRVLPIFRRLTEGRPVLIAASTLRGEEEPVLQAFTRIREVTTDAVLVIAPRHPERFVEAWRIAAAHGYDVARRTELAVDGELHADVVILDTIGELARLYQLATLVFVGGSLVPAGGHNFLEPAVFGKAVVFGQHMENFGEIARRFVECDAAWQVRTERDLEEALVVLMADPVRRASLGAAARALVDANRGAKRRTLVTMEGVLPPSPIHDANTAQTLRVAR